MKKVFSFLSLMLCISTLSFAQSPAVSAESANVKVTYGQPSKKGRVIFGAVWRNLEPYGVRVLMEQPKSLSKKM